jgi:hypothetical protein
MALTSWTPEWTVCRLVARRWRRRLSAHGKAAARIQEEVRLLKTGLEEGLDSDEEYRRLSDSIRVACDEQGIEIPDLPPFIRPEKSRPYSIEPGHAWKISRSSPRRAFRRSCDSASLPSASWGAER